MKVLVLFLVLFSSLSFAEESRPWWRVWQSVDQTTGVTETVGNTVTNRMFTPAEKDILNRFLSNRQSYNDSDERDDHDDDDDYKKEKHKNKDKHKNKHKDKGKGKQHALPPGLQKKVARGGQLPPGWQKKVARGEVLSGDLYSASSTLPQNILDQLVRQDGTSVRQVEDRVVRIMDATGLILDVLGN